MTRPRSVIEEAAATAYVAVLLVLAFPVAVADWAWSRLPRPLKSYSSRALAAVPPWLTLLGLLLVLSLASLFTYYVAWVDPWLSRWPRLSLIVLGTASAAALLFHLIRAIDLTYATRKHGS